MAGTTARHLILAQRRIILVWWPEDNSAGAQKRTINKLGWAMTKFNRYLNMEERQRFGLSFRMQTDISLNIRQHKGDWTNQESD
jgi:hypothetical protein